MLAVGPLPLAVRQGRSQVEQALGVDLFTYFAQDENIEEAALFARAMGDLSASSCWARWQP